MSQGNAGSMPPVPVSAGHKGYRAELDSLRERMRGRGFSLDEIAAEIGRRYRVRPREAYRLAREDDNPAGSGSQGRPVHDVGPAGEGFSLSLSLPYVPARLVIEVSGPAWDTDQVTAGGGHAEAGGLLRLVPGAARQGGAQGVAGT